MRSLAQFSTYQEVFKNAAVLPPFFETNLVDPGRVVKAFLNDPQAHIRIFYYQYLRLCFELENPKSETYVQKLQELVNNPTFQLIFYQDDDPSIYNDTNAKGLISQFFQLLGSGEYTVLDAVNNNPIMDVILVHFFRTLLILTNQAQTLDNYIPKEQLIDYLCNFFGVQVQFHGECCHYVQSDIFVYEQNESAVYMAYISPYDVESNYQSENLQSKESISVNPQLQQPAYVQPSYQLPPPAAVPTYVQPLKTTIPAPSQSYQTGKQSYIASEFVDYTHGVQPLDNKVKVNLKGSETNFNSFASPTTEVKVNANQYSTSQVESLGGNIPTTANKQLAFIETASISSGSQNKNISQYIHNIGSQPDYLMKSNPVTRGNVTQLQFEEVPASTTGILVQNKPLTPTPVSIYQPPVAQPLPTKDYNISATSTQMNQYNTQNQYSSLNTKVQTVLPPKPLSSNLSDSKKDIYYNPKLQSSSYNQYGANINTKTQTFDYKYTSSQVTSPKSTSPSVQLPGKKKPFGLNVSQQFTNSLTMKSMAEPYKSNVEGMKSRARNFRASLVNYIK